MFEKIYLDNHYKTIDPKEVKERLETDKDILLIDVRTPEEFAEAHIPNSISIPLNRIESDIGKVAKDKNAEMIVYCLSGRRAATACSQLTAMGYRNVSNMGGIKSWRYQTVSGHR
jgi:rhodanese-related sulfurtransferase